MLKAADVKGLPARELSFDSPTEADIDGSTFFPD